MKNIWLYSVRFYIRLGLFFYFKKIHTHNIDFIPKNKPVLFLANHQNALLDALLIATSNKRFSYFLTRAAVFKKPLVSSILKSLQMLPVYRVRDGWNNLSNNSAIFNTCAALFNKGEAIVIFPEGNHNLKRTVRPLSKGFTRIIFETYEQYPNTDLQLIPVGLNYVKAEKFPDSVSLFFGKPINAFDFISENKNEDVIKLKARIQLDISKLTTHIPLENYEEKLYKLKALNADFLNPKSVNSCIENGFTECEFNKKNDSNLLKKVFKFLLICCLIVPYLVWKYIVQPKIEDIEFTSTFRFAIALTLVPIWLLALMFFLAFTVGWFWAFIYLVTVLCIALITVKT